MINMAKSIYTLGSLVYKRKAPARPTAICEAFFKAIENKALKEKTTTFFDAYCKTMSKQNFRNNI